MSLHAGQVKKLLRGQIIIAKVTLERALGLSIVAVFEAYMQLLYKIQDTLSSLSPEYNYCRANGMVSDSR